MDMEVEELSYARKLVYNKVVAQKARIARSYNMKVRHRTFQLGELMWKVILPLDYRSKFGKWKPRWEGPFVIKRILGNGAYMQVDISSEILPRAINGKYLKKFVPSTWEHERVRVRREAQESGYDLMHLTLQVYFVRRD